MVLLVLFIFVACLYLFVDLFFGVLCFVVCGLFCCLDLLLFTFSFFCEDGIIVFLIVFSSLGGCFRFLYASIRKIAACLDSPVVWVQLNFLFYYCVLVFLRVGCIWVYLFFYVSP